MSCPCPLLPLLSSLFFILFLSSIPPSPSCPLPKLASSLVMLLPHSKLMAPALCPPPLQRALSLIRALVLGEGVEVGLGYCVVGALVRADQVEAVVCRKGVLMRV